MLFGKVEIVDITYGTAISLKEEPFAKAQTVFNNPGPTSIRQKWKLEERYTSTNTYSWETKTHVGVNVSAKVGFHGTGASVGTEASIDFTTGESSTISETFTWTMSQTVDVPCEAGMVNYEAIIFRVPTTIPFTATFKRGDMQWQESGKVAVSHGIIYSKVSSVERDIDRPYTVQ